MAESCHTIETPDEVLYCTDPNCLCGGKQLADWNEEVRQFKDKLILWNKIWHEAGCPSVGVLSQLRKHAKSRYKSRC